MEPRRFLPDGTECDEEGYPILRPTLPPDGSPPITSNPGSGVDLRTGKMTASGTPETLALQLHWSVPVCANTHPTPNHFDMSGGGTSLIAAELNWRV